jgi:Flp pilus assembly protein TadD
VPYSYRKQDVSPEPSISPPGSAGAIKQSYVIVVGALLFIAFVILFFFLTRQSYMTQPVTIKPAAQQSATVVENTTIAKRRVASDVPVTVSSVKLTTDNNFDLDFALNTWTAYTVHFSNEHKTVNMTIFNADVAKQSEVNVSRPNVTYTASGLKLFGDFAAKGVRIDSFVHNNDLHITLEFPKTVHLTKSHITKSHPAALQLQFDVTEMADVVVLPEETRSGKPKDAMVVDYHDNANAVYETAKNLLAMGKYDEAVAQLQENPLSVFENEKVCLLLTKLYLKQQAFVLAERTASQGLTVFSHSVDLRKLWAQATFSMSNYAKSLSILQERSPDVAKNLDYYSLLASAALKLEKYELASGVYRSLLSFKPSNADWWTGLAITLQGQGKDNLALEAYHRALQSGGLSADLVGYVRTQIQNLQ